MVNTGEVSTGYILCTFAGGKRLCNQRRISTQIFSLILEKVSKLLHRDVSLNFTQLVLRPAVPLAAPFVSEHATRNKDIADQEIKGGEHRESAAEGLLQPGVIIYDRNNSEMRKLAIIRLTAPSQNLLSFQENLRNQYPCANAPADGKQQHKQDAKDGNVACIVGVQTVWRDQQADGEPMVPIFIIGIRP